MADAYSHHPAQLHCKTLSAAPATLEPDGGLRLRGVGRGDRAPTSRERIGTPGGAFEPSSTPARKETLPVVNGEAKRGDGLACAWRSRVE